VSTRHDPIATHLGIAALSGAATYATLLSWRGFSEDSSAYLVPLFWAVLLIAGVGAALRALGINALVVLLVQVAGGGLLLNMRWAGTDSWGGVIPTTDSVLRVGQVVYASGIEAGRWAAPVPEAAINFSPLLLLGGVGVALVADFLAGGLRRIPLAGLPLLAAFTAPVSVLGGVSWLTFCIAALPFVLLLAMDRAAQLARWGNQLSTSPAATAQVRDSQPRRVRTGTLWPLASKVGLAGVGLAALAPAVLPSTAGLFTTAGSGRGSGDEVRISNPMVDIQRDLTRGEDIPLIRLETNDPDPAYLRLTVLDEFDGEAWRPSQRDIPESNRVGERFPLIPGLRSGTPRERHSSRITGLDGFSSTWLPLPYPATSVDVAGDWRYDSDTLDVVAASDGLDVAGLTYETTALTLRPAVEQLVDAPPAPRSLSQDGTELPDDTPEWLGELAEEVTAGSESAFQEAVALQRWFREDDSFTYSLDRASGSSLTQLEQFLGEGPGSREGYCEQFASAMAMMARTLGIPARVAVGFLRPAEVAEGEYLYSTYDLHAWPELYFEGSGWIRFEPTPQDRATDVPSYTSARVPTPGEARLPGESPSPSAATVPRPQADRLEEEAATASSSGGGSGWGWLVPLGAALLVAMVVATPRTVRARLARRRLRPSLPSPAEGGWAELRATALDLGLEWDDRQTLRRRAMSLVRHLSGDRAAVTALEGLVLLVERGRYSLEGLPGSRTASVVPLVETVTEALRAGVPTGVRRRAAWLPASLWRGWRTQRGRYGAGDATSADRELDLVSL